MKSFITLYHHAHPPILKGHCFQNSEFDSGESHPPQTSYRCRSTDSDKLGNK